MSSAASDDCRRRRQAAAGLAPAFEPSPDQWRGIDWMQSVERLYDGGILYDGSVVVSEQNSNRNPRGGVLVDPMGAGKTFQALFLIAADWAAAKAKAKAKAKARPSAGVAVGATLVTAAKSVVSQWWSESRRFFPDLPVVWWDGQHMRSSHAGGGGKYAVFLVHYDALTALYRRRPPDPDPDKEKKKAKDEEAGGSDAWTWTVVRPRCAHLPVAARQFRRDDPRVPSLFRTRWRRLVVDEAHVLRNPRTELAQLVFSLHARYAWALTGTPAYHQDLDLWSLFRLVEAPRLRPRQRMVRDLRALQAEEAERRERKRQRLKGNKRPKSGDLPTVPSDRAQVARHELRRLVSQVLWTSSAAAAASASGTTKVTGTRVDGWPDETLLVERTERLPHRCWIRYVSADLRRDERRLYVRARDRAVSAPPNSRKRKAPDSSDDDRRGVGGGANAGEATTGKSYASMLAALNAARFAALVSPAKLRMFRRYLGIESRSSGAGADKDEDKDKGGPSPVRPGDKVLVFCEWTRGCDVLAREAERGGRRVLRADGSLTIQQRAAVLRDFARTGPGTPDVLVTTFCLGEGLNIPSANHVVFCAPWWCESRERQALSRAHRPGQTRDVHVAYLCLRDTIEPVVRRVARSQGTLTRALVGELFGDLSASEAKRGASR